MALERFDRASGREIVEAGIGAGVLAGLVMGVVLMVHSAATGMGFFYPVQLIGAFWGFDVTALEGANGFWAFVSGLLTHLVTACAWALLFTAAVRRWGGVGADLVVGVCYGIFVWLVMTYAFLPWAHPEQYAWAQSISGAWFFYHLVYGLFVGMAPVLLRRIHPLTYAEVITR